MLVAGFGSFLYLPVPAVSPRNKPQATLGVRRTCAWTATGVTSAGGTAGSVGTAAASREMGFFAL